MLKCYVLGGRSRRLLPRSPDLQAAMNIFFSGNSGGDRTDSLQGLVKADRTCADAFTNQSQNLFVISARTDPQGHYRFSSIF